MRSTLPQPVGLLSDRVVTLLRGSLRPGLVSFDDISDPFDHDAQLALYLLNETHYGGWSDAKDWLEWDPHVVHWRTSLWNWFEGALRAALEPNWHRTDPLVEAHRLLALDGPSVSRHLAERGTVDEVIESMLLRSPYQSKEADPHTFVIPRLSGSAKRTMCEIQAGEYGVGHARSHAELFADALEGLGLDPTPNAHIDHCDGVALAGSNLVTLGAMQRRLRGVAVGQLALFEMDSVVPNGRMVTCCDRLELPDSVRRFFHIHVLADAEHEVLAAQSFLVDYPTAEPEQAQNVLLGMRAQSLIDQRLAADLVPRWSQSAALQAVG